MTDRNRREDLLKVADLVISAAQTYFDHEEEEFTFDFDQFFHYADVLTATGQHTERGVAWSEEQKEYARDLFAELPAFLKAEWAAYRGEPDEFLHGEAYPDTHFGPEFDD